jgi:hypothetical protein
MSEDFNKYFVKTISGIKSDKIYDLFFEIGEKFETANVSEFRGMYISEVFRYFKDTIKVKVSENKKNKKIESKQKNLRLHYVNIRDYMKTHINEDLNDIRSIIYDMSCNKSILKIDLEELYQNVLSLEKNIKEIIELFQNPKSDNSNKISYYINKMMKKYKHRELKTKLIEPVLDIIYNNFDKLIKKIENFHLAISEIKDKIIYPNELTEAKNGEYFYGNDSYFILESINKLNELYLDIEYYATNGFSTIMDLFFLRRFLDKDYITNGIVYTGGFHSVFYIYILVKYFDFKITHISYIEKNIKNIEELENKIKNISDFKKLMKYLFPHKLSQCANLTNFPPNFE